MNRRNIITIIVALILYVTTASADIVKGLVLDSETKEPLAEASVECMFSVGEHGFAVTTATTDSLGVFNIVAFGRSNIKVSMFGYYEKSKPVLALSGSQKDTLDIGTIELKMSTQMLKMVEISARVRRFTVRGDTIVFHPEAFHLEEGARLDELIRKLPGVEIDDEGKMSWNGKPIRLTMDGESMLGGEELIKQLPAEAVQDIKAYNKSSEFSERTGKDDGTQDMVLDLTIKPGFLDRWYGDVKAGYQTPKYYEGELTMNRLSKTDPVMVFANVNNKDYKIHKSMQGQSSWWSNGFGQAQGAAAGYQHKWKEKSGSHELKNQYSFVGGLQHQDSWRTIRSDIENYFPNTADSHISNESNNRKHELNPYLNVDLRWATDSLNTFYVRASAEHKRKRSNGREQEEREEQNAMGDYQPTLSQLVTTGSEEHETDIDTELRWEHYVKDGALGASVSLEYNEGETDGQNYRTITAHSPLYTSSQLTQTYTSPSRLFSTKAETHYAHWITKKWMMQAQYSLTYSHKRDDRDFQTNGVADAANSYLNRYTRHEHNLRLAQTINLTPVQFMPNISARWQRESQNYQRGMLDTAAVRRCVFIDPSLLATWKLNKTTGFSLEYSFRTRQPEIIQTIGYRDLINPLYITEGNPNLLNTHTHDIRLTYNMILSRSQTSLSATVSYNHNDQETTTAQSYDPSTGVYVSRPENVRGSKSWNIRLNLDQGIGDYFRLQSDFRMNGSQRYGYLTMMPTQMERTLNRQSGLAPRENLTVSLDYNWLKASVFTEIGAEQLRYTASPEQNTTIWDNRYGLSAEATVGSFVFKTVIAEGTHRGYTISSMNRNILSWDASVTWKILKNKGLLTLEFDDILNNEDGRYSQQTAYQKFTTWQDFRHHYIDLSFTYHLDAKKKE